MAAYVLTLLYLSYDYSLLVQKHTESISLHRNCSMKWTTGSSALEHIHSLLFCIKCNIVDATAALSTFFLHWVSVVISFAVLCSLLRKHTCIPTQSALVSLSDGISRAKCHRGGLDVTQRPVAPPAISSRLTWMRERGACCAVLLTAALVTQAERGCDRKLDSDICI